MRKIQKNNKYDTWDASHTHIRTSRNRQVFKNATGDNGSEFTNLSNIENNEISMYILLNLVLHEQSNSIKKAVKELDKWIKENGFDVYTIYSGHIIRNEGFYKPYNLRIERDWE